MDRDCIGVEDLEQVSHSPEGDPRRMHVRACPRCASRLASLQLFEDLRSPASGANLDDADARLQDFVSGLGRRRTRVPRRSLSWGLVAAAAAVVLLLTWPPINPGVTPSAVLRGDGQAPAQLNGGEARWAEDGALRLSWDDPAETAVSEVVFLSLDLRELTRIPADAPGRLNLDAASIPRALAHGQALLWSVVSQQDGEDHSITASALLER